MPPKRRGRKGGDSDDDPLAEQLAHLKMIQEESGSTVQQDDAPAIATNSKKEKKSGKKSNDSDDESNVKSVKSALLNEKEDKKNAKNTKKSGKKGKHNDSDDEAPVASTKKGRNDDEDEEPTKGGKSKAKKGGKRNNDSDDEAEPTNKKSSKTAVPAPVPAATKKNKKKGGKRNNYSSDDGSDVDPLKAMKAAAAAGSDSDEQSAGEEDEDDDEEERLRNIAKAKAQKQQQAAKQSVPAPASKKDKKKGKKGGKHQNDSDDDADLAKLQSLLAGPEKDSEDEEDDEESEEEVKPVAKAGKKGKDGKKQPAAAEAVPAPVAATSGKKDKKSKNKLPTPPPSDDEEEDDEDEESASESEEENEEVKPVVKPAAAVPAVVVQKAPEPVAAPAPVVEPIAAPLPTPAPITNTSSTATQQKNKYSKHVSEPVAAPVAAAPVASNKPKSKLELKLEKARKEKEAADALAAEAARVEAIAAAERERLRFIEEERLKAEKAAQDAADLAAKQAAAAAEESDSDSDGEDDDDQESKPKTQEEKDAEARMMATMYGDEVFSEYATHDRKPGADDEDDDAGPATGSKKERRAKDKLSNKAKRKLVKEAESKEREKEFNIAAMKASIEGAQFAVSQSIVDVNDPQWQNALDIIIPSVSISAHSKELFVNTELNIVHGRRYGLVGPNGAGKSTLLKMIASGELKVPPRVDYLYVEQEVLADETPAVDAVLKADKVRWELIQEEKSLMAQLEKAPSEALDQRLGEVYEALANIGAASAESRARRILFGLGFDREMQIRPTKYFSGGWRMRISLARALFIEPTLLMLDEPTNHLDLNAVIWLDDYLQKWKKTLLVVSHDQDFLNSVCQEVIHLDSKKLVSYKGNYDNFKEQEAVKRKQQQKDWEKQEKKLRELKSKGVTKDNAEKAQLKAKSREPGARSKKAEASKVSSGGASSVDSQVTLIARPRDYSVVFSFPEVTILSPPIMEVRDVNFQYAPNLPWLFRGLNFGLDMQSRVCIVGPNGSGKSTVIKLITEELKPPEGEVRRNPRLRVGVYNQHFVDRLPMDEDPVTYLRRLYSEETYQSCRNKLGKYGLEGHAHTIPIRDLSGGQKARVVFVELSLMAPHLLFLDEPTNNLDIESIDALCIALKEFNGGVVMVSHDARLIESTDCQLWVVEDQNVTPWESGFTGYREHLLKKLEEQLNAIMPGSGERPGEKA